MAETVKVLKADNYKAVIEVLEQAGADELVAFIEKELDAHNNRQEKAKARAAKKKQAEDAILPIVKDVILALEAPATRDEIFEQVEAQYDGDIELTVNKVGARINTLVKDEVAAKAVKTVDKKRKTYYIGYEVGFGGEDTE